jgi:hypothetical protein
MIQIPLAAAHTYDFDRDRRAAGQWAFPMIKIFFLLFLKPNLYFLDKHFQLN